MDTFWTMHWSKWDEIQMWYILSCRKRRVSIQHSWYACNKIPTSIRYFCIEKEKGNAVQGNNFEFTLKFNRRWTALSWGGVYVCSCVPQRLIFHYTFSLHVFAVVYIAHLQRHKKLNTRIQVNEDQLVFFYQWSYSGHFSTAARKFFYFLNSENIICISKLNKQSKKP